jgi:hypothetical protein
MMGFEWRSVPRDELQAWFIANWAFVMPDSDKPGNYIVEWRSHTAPVEPHRVPETENRGNADERAGT